MDDIDATPADSNPSAQSRKRPAPIARNSPHKRNKTSSIQPYFNLSAPGSDSELDNETTNQVEAGITDDQGQIMLSTRQEDADLLGMGQEQQAGTSELDVSSALDPCAKEKGMVSKRKGGRLGRLRSVLDRMPGEILAEILSHLTPATLLRLARIAWVFRHFLMSASSIRVWRNAFKNDGISRLFHCTVPRSPGLLLPWMEPKFLSHGPAPDPTTFEIPTEQPVQKARNFDKFRWTEPGIASLIWDKECNRCNRVKVHKIIYPLCERICDVCFKKLLDHREHYEATQKDIHPFAWECVPTTTRPPWHSSANLPFHTPFFLIPALQDISNFLWALEVEDKANPLPIDPSIPDIQPKEDTLTVVEDGKIVEDASKEDPNKDLNLNSRVGQWIHRDRVERALVAEDMSLLNLWQISFDKSRSDNKKNARTERIKDIKSRLLALDYSEAEIDMIAQPNSGSSSVWNQMDQPYPLTDRVWKKIQPIIVDALELERQQNRNCISTSPTIIQYQPPANFTQSQQLGGQASLPQMNSVPSTSHNVSTNPASVSFSRGLNPRPTNEPIFFPRYSKEPTPAAISAGPSVGFPYYPGISALVNPLFNRRPPGMDSAQSHKDRMKNLRTTTLSPAQRPRILPMNHNFPAIFPRRPEEIGARHIAQPTQRPGPVLQPLQMGQRLVGPLTQSAPSAPSVPSASSASALRNAWISDIRNEPNFTDARGNPRGNPVQQPAPGSTSTTRPFGYQPFH